MLTCCASEGGRPCLFADKSAPTKTGSSRTSRTSPGQLPRPAVRSLDAPIFCATGLMQNGARAPVGVDLSTKTDYQTPTGSLKRPVQA
ncbi:hypothetical protein C6383_17210 [Pseudomonas syringae pv. actinidiae]|nr:hypothetical protein C6379_26545 [Pseudomonas syringae pv. actinidiae]RJX58707.1 hypothetical protein C6383_17210 [Pseudomonas syringae pv. actinidiae]